MSCRIFNFFLDSLNYDNATNNNNVSYFIDWSSVLPRGKYECYVYICH